MIDQKILDIFNRLYDDTYKAVLSYVVCRCACLDDAADIVQDVYVEVVKKFERGSADADLAYLLGIAANKLKRYYRFKYKARLSLLFSSDDEERPLPEPASDFDTESDFLHHEDAEAVWNFLKRKKPVVGKVFYLRYYADMTIEQIAVELSLSTSAVKNHLYRTLRELRSFIEERSE